MSKVKCCWILKPATKEQKAEYCNKPTRYIMVKDDDDNSIRKYNHFCDEHQKNS